MKKQVDNSPHLFELKLANGKSRTFRTGQDMWTWAAQNSKMEFPKDDVNPPTLSEWFEKRRAK